MNTFFFTDKKSNLQRPPISTTTAYRSMYCAMLSEAFNMYGMSNIAIFDLFHLYQ